MILNDLEIWPVAFILLFEVIDLVLIRSYHYRSDELINCTNQF